MDLSKIFSDFIEKDRDFQEVLKIVESNSKGRVWLIGGYISRNLANILYSTGKPEEGDYDFLVEEINDTLSVPENWEIRTNSFGNQKIVNTLDGMEADIVPITNVHSIITRHLEPTIDNFLSGVPLNIQAICYEMNTHKLIGAAGIESIKNKTITLHNKPAAKHRAEMKGISQEDLATKVAESFGFDTQF